MNRYNVLNRLTTDIKIEENPYHFELDTLFSMAMRINKKRSFLFVSKVLGKHLAVAPQIPILTGHLLAHRFLAIREQQVQKTTEQLVHAIKHHKNVAHMLEWTKNEPLLSQKPLRIIGFAETATALGHAFFDAFAGDVQYIHTTREWLIDREPTICFEEEHSHASSHRLYADDAFFEQAKEIVLVDDEMTTGKTNQNIIRQLHTAYPHIEVYTLVAILDWRDLEQLRAMQLLATELHITIEVVSLLKGRFNVQVIGQLPEEAPLSKVDGMACANRIAMQQTIQQELVIYHSQDELGRQYEVPYFRGSGRFALTTEQQAHYMSELQRVANQLRAQRMKGNCLVLGTGEFMFAPMWVAAHMGEDVFYHSTTRSPIYAHEASIISTKHRFESAEHPGVMNYLYNIPAGMYEEIFVIFERVLNEEAVGQLVYELQSLTKQVHVVTIGG